MLKYAMLYYKKINFIRKNSIVCGTTISALAPVAKVLIIPNFIKLIMSLNIKFYNTIEDNGLIVSINIIKSF